MNATRILVAASAAAFLSMGCGPAETGDCAALERLAFAPSPAFEAGRRALPGDEVRCTETLGTGTLSGTYVRARDGRDRLTLRYAGADLATILARHKVDAPLGGSLSGTVELRRSKEPRTTNGALDLSVEGFSLGGGPLLGESIPALRAGTAKLAAKLADGELALESLTADGQDLSGQAKGTLSLAAGDGFLRGSPRLDGKVSVAAAAIEGSEGGKRLADGFFVARGGKLEAQLSMSGSMDAPKLRARGKAPRLAAVKRREKAPNEEQLADLEQAVWGFVDQAGTGSYRVRAQAREALLSWPVMLEKDGKPERRKDEKGKLTGVRLASVRENGVLQAFGLRSGDVIVEVNGRPLDSERAVEAALEDGATASELELSIERRGRPETVILRLEGAPVATAEK